MSFVSALKGVFVATALVASADASLEPSITQKITDIRIPSLFDATSSNIQFTSHSGNEESYLSIFFKVAPPISSKSIDISDSYPRIYVLQYERIYERVKESIEAGVNPADILDSYHDESISHFFNKLLYSPTDEKEADHLLATLLKNPKVQKLFIDNFDCYDLIKRRREGLSASCQKRTDLVLSNLGNKLDKHGSTLLHRAIREGDIDGVDHILDSHEGREIVLSASNHISHRSLRDCRATPEFERLYKMSLSDFAYPFTVAQNSCNTIVKLANGKLEVFKHTDAAKVLEALKVKKQSSTIQGYLTSSWNSIFMTTSPSKPHIAQLYIHPEHSFVSLESSNSKVTGLYPHGINLNEYKYKKESDIFGHLKLIFHISESQALAFSSAMDKPQKDYNAFSHNCVDFAVERFESIGIENPLMYFNLEQLTNPILKDLINPSQWGYTPTIFYAFAKYRIGISESLLPEELRWDVTIAYNNKESVPKAILDYFARIFKHSILDIATSASVNLASQGPAASLQLMCVLKKSWLNF
jgi:hypothetical protein